MTARISQTIASGLLFTLLSLAGKPAVSQSSAELESIWYNCSTRERFSPQKQIWCDRWRKLQSATLIVPTSLDPDPDYTTVTLANGRYQRSNEQLFVELANERNWLTFGDLNDDGKTDAALIFGVALDPNGRSIGTFLTAVMDIDDTAQAISPVRLGDRILLNGPIAINPNQIVVPFLTQTAAFDRVYQLNRTLRSVPSAP